MIGIASPLVDLDNKAIRASALCWQMITGPGIEATGRPGCAGAKALGDLEVDPKSYDHGGDGQCPNFITEMTASASNLFQLCHQIKSLQDKNKMIQVNLSSPIWSYLVPQSHSDFGLWQPLVRSLRLISFPFLLCSAVALYSSPLVTPSRCIHNFSFLSLSSLHPPISFRFLFLQRWHLRLL
jgi:hypothetical protein